MCGFSRAYLKERKVFLSLSLGWYGGDLTVIPEERSESFSYASEEESPHLSREAFIDRMNSMFTKDELLEILAEFVDKAEE